MSSLTDGALVGLRDLSEHGSRHDPHSLFSDVAILRWTPDVVSVWRRRHVGMKYAPTGCVPNGHMLTFVTL